MCDENQAIDNGIIHPYMTCLKTFDTHNLRYSEHSMCDQKKLNHFFNDDRYYCFFLYIFKTTYSFQLHDSKKNITY